MLTKYSINLEKNNRNQYWFIAFIVLVYAGIFNIPLIDNDAAHHANIALNMYNSGNYINLIDRGQDYLDKPHFLFWVSVISFKLFGVTTFAYRLPPVLFALLSVYSVYKLTKHLSNTTTAKIAALILATAQGFIFSIIDARMEAPLTASIALGLWQIVVYIDNRKISNLILAAIGTAAAFDTKGWIGPIVILLSAFLKIVIEKKWNVLTSVKTWLFIPFFILFILPVLYAYYVQFDLHPEKVVRGMTNISGVKFILWNQNFQRFTSNTWDTNGRNSSYFFLYHTFLWAFAPWCIAAYIAMLYWLRRMFYKKKRTNAFNFAALSFAFILFFISFSKFKMPHYIIMLFPLAAVFTAPYLRLALSFTKSTRWFYPFHFFIAALSIPVCLVLNYYFFKPINLWVGIAGCLLLLLLLLLLIKRNANKGLKVLYLSAFFVLMLNFFMVYNFFPNLMQYQGGNMLAGNLLNTGIRLNDNDVLLIDTDSHSFDFNMKHTHTPVVMDSILQNKVPLENKYFLLHSSNKKQLEDSGFIIQSVALHINYQVSKVKLKFLNEKTRTQMCDSLFLGKIYKR